MMGKILLIYIITLLMKLYGYFISGYLVLLADALHGISDIAGILLLAYSGFIAKKPGDISHPLGHEMARNVASLIVAISFITIIAFELLKEGIKKMMMSSQTHLNTEIALLIEIGVILLLIIASFLLAGRKGILNRTLFIESINDSLSTMAAILGIILVGYGYMIFDGIVSIIIAIMISYNAIQIIHRNTRFLMGMSPSDEFYQRVEKVCSEFEEVKGVHDMVATYIGEDRIHLDMHITVDKKMKIDEADKLSMRISRKLQEEIPEIAYVMIHFCPHYGNKRKII